VKDVHYGGQAVIEGVMIRGATHMAVAVRRPAGDILVHSEALPVGIYGGALGRMPFVRGLTMLWDTLVLGVRALMFSADAALQEEDVEFSGPMMWGTLFAALALGVGLFTILPMFLVSLADRYIAIPLVSNIAEGFVRLGLFLVYLVAIGRMPDIQRVFGYHGAEHKTVNAYEADSPLTADAVRPFTTAHTRCGTGFLLVVLVLFVFLTSLLGRPPLLWRLLSRLALLPVVAALSYEFIKFSARHEDNPLVRLLVAPSLLLQRLTTREPDDSMVEVAIAALKTVAHADVAGSAPSTPAATSRA
jgi:uncharacterized protein YqhQ